MSSLCYGAPSAGWSDFSRSQIFMWFEAAVLLAEIVSPPVGSLLMKYSIWLPILINSACCGVSILLSWYIPETRQYAVRQANTEHTETPTTASDEDRSGLHDGSSRATSLVDNLQKRLLVIISQWNIFLLVLSFLVANFARDSMAFLLQYISNRYSWPIAKVKSTIPTDNESTNKPMPIRQATCSPSVPWPSSYNSFSSYLLLTVPCANASRHGPKRKTCTSLAAASLS